MSNHKVSHEFVGPFAHAVRLGQMSLVAFIAKLAEVGIEVVGMGTLTSMVMPELMVDIEVHPVLTVKLRHRDAAVGAEPAVYLVDPVRAVDIDKQYLFDEEPICGDTKAVAAAGRYTVRTIYLPMSPGITGRFGVRAYANPEDARAVRSYAYDTLEAAGTMYDVLTERWDLVEIVYYQQRGQVSRLD